MGNAQKKPDGSRQPHKLLADLAKEYEPLLGEAKLASTLTYTDAWVSLYREELKAHRTVEKELAERLGGLGKYMEGGNFSEDDEKSLGEVKKFAQELRQRKVNFDASTVDPIRNTVNKCDDCLNSYIDKASRLEENAPLIDRGIEQQVRDFIAGLYRPEWNAKAGQINLLVPTTE